MTRYRGPEARTVQRRVRVLKIEDLWGRTRWERGVYAFTTLDSMTRAQRAAATWIWSELAARPAAFACLNDPSRVLHRFPFLRALHEQGLNDFNVHRLDDLGRVRFPAFVRYENLHRANLTGIVRTRDELEDAVAGLLLRGERADELIVTEFLDYRSEDGLYRKWGAHVCGSRVLAKHVFVGTDWMLKMKHSRRRLVGGEEREYVRANPHAATLEPVFELSGCTWARVDYSFWKGRMQVWEMNDNPEFGKKWKHDLGRRPAHAVFYRGLEAALEEVSAPLEPGEAVEIGPVPVGVVLED
jgi:hypothetical protein